MLSCASDARRNLADPGFHPRVEAQNGQEARINEFKWEHAQNLEKAVLTLNSKKCKLQNSQKDEPLVAEE